MKFRVVAERRHHLSVDVHFDPAAIQNGKISNAFQNWSRTGGKGSTEPVEIARSSPSETGIIMLMFLKKWVERTNKQNAHTQLLSTRPIRKPPDCGGGTLGQCYPPIASQRHAVVFTNSCGHGASSTERSVSAIPESGRLKTRDLTSRDHRNCGGWHRETGQLAPYCKGGHRETCFIVRVEAQYKLIFAAGSIIWAAHRLYVCSFT